MSNSSFRPVQVVQAAHPLISCNPVTPGAASFFTFHADILPVFFETFCKISSYENGPSFFYLNLDNKLAELDHMMTSLQKVEHEKLSLMPVLGMACLSELKVRVVLVELIDVI